jgi:hypothetical protein
MNSGSAHKIYNYEVTPPAGVWDKISTSLDESELSSNFPLRLRNYKAVPPPEAWGKIAAVLYGSSFINDYATKLEAIEVTPPLSAWDRIEQALDRDHVNQEPKKIIPWIRYAAAAAIIGLLAWGGTRLLNNSEGSPALATQEEPVPFTPKNTVAAPLVSNNLPAPETQVSEEARNNAALEASKKTFARLDSRHSTKIRNAADFYFAAETDDASTRGIPDFEEQEMEKINTNNRYIVLMTPEGNIIRMSKKLSDLVCCVSGETEEKDCVDQMKKWREKMAYTAAGHSPGNFLEILNLVCSLEQE